MRECRRPERPSALPPGQAPAVQVRSGDGHRLSSPRALCGQTAYFLIGLCKRGPGLAPGYPGSQGRRTESGVFPEATFWLCPVSQKLVVLSFGSITRRCYAQRCGWDGKKTPVTALSINISHNHIDLHLDTSRAPLSEPRLSLLGASRLRRRPGNSDHLVTMVLLIYLP